MSKKKTSGRGGGDADGAASSARRDRAGLRVLCSNGDSSYVTGEVLTLLGGETTAA
jgi:hypothetical protein